MAITKPPGIDLVWNWRYGNSQAFNVTFLLNGVAIDLHGYTVYFMVKSSFLDDDADALLSKEITNHSSPDTGTTAVILSSGDMEALPVKNGYFFELKYLNPVSGELKTGAVGILNIQQVVKQSVS